MVGTAAWEMCQWEVHALRAVATKLLALAGGMSRPIESGRLTPVGLLAECEHVLDDFERDRYAALRDEHFRRESLGGTSRIAR
jgi:hypothetical protein